MPARGPSRPLRRLLGSLSQRGATDDWSPFGVCDCPERRDLNITDTLAAWPRVRLCSDVAAWAGGWSVRLFAPAPASSPVPGLLSSRTLSVFRGRR